MTEDSPKLGTLQPEVALTCYKLVCPLFGLRVRVVDLGQLLEAFCSVKAHQEYTGDNTHNVVKNLYEERIPAGCPLFREMLRPKS